MPRGEPVPMCRECGHALAWGCYRCEDKAREALKAELATLRETLVVVQRSFLDLLAKSGGSGE